jgi:cyanophycinase
MGAKLSNHLKSNEVGCRACWLIRCRCLFFVAFALLSHFTSLRAADSPSYRYYRVGNSADIQTKTQPGFALIGGGKDLDAAFLWMCQRSGGGDFLVLRATGTDAYNPYIQTLCHLNSVSTLVIPDRQAAKDPFVQKTIRNAEAIFISGGDQANYINFWKGTPVQELLNDAIRKGVPIGGTSAGLAVQGEYIYSAQNDPPDGPDLSSRLALADPFHPQVVIVHGFLDDPAMNDTITDTHFVTRNRMGRLLAFMARTLAANSLSSLKGVGIDEQTAVLLEPDGQGSIVGHGAAYFFLASAEPPAPVKGVALTMRRIAVQKLTSGGSFNFKSWKGNSISYDLSVDAGVIHSTQPGGSIY